MQGASRVCLGPIGVPVVTRSAARDAMLRGLRLVGGLIMLLVSARSRGMKVTGECPIFFSLYPAPHEAARGGLLTRSDWLARREDAVAVFARSRHGPAFRICLQGSASGSSIARVWSFAILQNTRKPVAEKRIQRRDRRNRTGPIWSVENRLTVLRLLISVCCLAPKPCCSASGIFPKADTRPSVATYLSSHLWWITARPLLGHDRREQTFV